MEPSIAELREILRVFADSDLRDLHLEVGDVRLHASKDGAVAGGAPVWSLSTADGEEYANGHPGGAGERDPAGPPDAAVAVGDPGRAGLVAVRAPVLGVLYRRPAPDQPPYVEVGDQVTAETPVATIEVMKMYTEVQAGCEGVVVEFSADDEELVEHGQILLYVDPAANAG